MGVFYSIIATHEEASFPVRLGDPRVQRIVSDALKQPLCCKSRLALTLLDAQFCLCRWRDCYKKPLAPVATIETVPAVAAAVQGLSNQNDGEQEVNEEQPAAEVDDAKRMEEERTSAKKTAVTAVARAEIARYLRFIIADPSDPVALKSVIEPQLSCSPVFCLPATSAFSLIQVTEGLVANKRRPGTAPSHLGV